MIIKWKLSNGLVGCSIKSTVEVEDDADEKVIEQAVHEDMWNYLELSWEKEIKNNEGTGA